MNTAPPVSSKELFDYLFLMDHRPQTWIEHDFDTQIMFVLELFITIGYIPKNKSCKPPRELLGPSHSNGVLDRKHHH